MLIESVSGEYETKNYEAEPIVLDRFSSALVKINLERLPESYVLTVLVKVDDHNIECLH
jgi:hypothetical protein